MLSSKLSLILILWNNSLWRVTLLWDYMVQCKNELTIIQLAYYILLCMNDTIWWIQIVMKQEKWKRFCSSFINNYKHLPYTIILNCSLFCRAITFWHIEKKNAFVFVRELRKIYLTDLQLIRQRKGQAIFTVWSP